MTKFTDAVVANLEARFEDGDIPEGPDFAAWIARIQEGIQEHTHASTGGAGSGTGDAARILPNRYLFALPGYTINGLLSQIGPYSTMQALDTKITSIRFAFRVPYDFGSFTSLKLVWLSAAASGNMKWRLNAAYASAGENYLTHEQNSGTGVTATGGANLINVQTPQTPLTLAGLAQGDYVGIEFLRYATEAEDTLNNDVHVLGLLFSYATN